MITLIKKTNINFVKNRLIFFTVSGLLILASLISISTKGMNLGLDFTGGTLMQVHFSKPVTINQLRKALSVEKIDANIQTFADGEAFQIKVKGKEENVNKVANLITKACKENLPDNTFTEDKRDFVGPVVGHDLAKKGMFAIILSLCAIIIYIAFRFSNPLWGTAGIAALAHDVIITAGLMSVTGREVGLVELAAFLTLVGYSINNTIVIFDRMRETLHTFPKMDFGELVDLSINETMSRTIITSLTVVLVTLILFLFGGTVINNFALIMLFGTVIGTYSSICISSQLVYQWVGAHKRR